MPLYEYQCRSCGHRFERIQKFSDPPVSECPECGASDVEKLISSPAFQFKGSGWYITDYARKSDASRSETKDSDSTSGGETSASKDDASKTRDKSADKSAGKPEKKSSDSASSSKPASSGTSD